MQAVVKTPRIEIRIKGEIPPKLLSILTEEYGKRVRLSDDEEDELVDIVESAWFKGVKAKTTPGEKLRTYRENRSLTQAQLGAMLGGIPRQHVSNMEHGLRPISLKMARGLAKVFGVSPSRFI